MVPSRLAIKMPIAFGQCIGEKCPVTFLDGLYSWTKRYKVQRVQFVVPTQKQRRGILTVTRAQQKREGL